MNVITAVLFDCYEDLRADRIQFEEQLAALTRPELDPAELAGITDAVESPAHSR